MTTRIPYNGSHWAGEAPDTLAQLLDVLGREPLDPRFEHYGDFAHEVKAGDELAEAHDLPAGGVIFSGNFLVVSHAFSVITDEPDVQQTLFAAIRANRASTAYRLARPLALERCHCPRCWDPSATTRSTRQGGR